MNAVTEDDMTLDPPGSIAVIGAGVLGIEAALYGRFLGYDVTLLEAKSVGHSMRDQLEQPLPILPDRFLSSLALAALSAQSDREHFSTVLPTSYQQLIEQALVPLTESDLLAGRLRAPARVVQIDAIPVPPDDDESVLQTEIPADFRLTIDAAETCDVEAVIVATAESHLPPESRIRKSFQPPVPYYFSISQNPDEELELHLRNGRREIVDVFAKLAGRKDLDLYRPKRN